MQEIAGNRTPGRLALGFRDSRVFAAISLGGIDFRPEMLTASYDNVTGQLAYGGSGSGDVLWGGKRNDVLTGGLGGDIYIFQRGDGQDVISERGGFSFGRGAVPADWRRGVVRQSFRLVVNDNQMDHGGCVTVCVVDDELAAA
jgi:Ca2+-binding RTX toxin-like protein